MGHRTTDYEEGGAQELDTCGNVFTIQTDCWFSAVEIQIHFSMGAPVSTGGAERTAVTDSHSALLKSNS